jgi:hypothetical protein
MEAKQITSYDFQNGVNRKWAQAQEMFLDNNKAVFGPHGLDVFIMCYSQALALAAVNPEVYVMIPSTKQRGPADKTTWANIELPFLTRNPNIKKIYQVDPRDPKDGGTPCDEPTLSQIHKRRISRVCKSDNVFGAPKPTTMCATGTFPLYRKSFTVYMILQTLDGSLREMQLCSIPIG